jgi:hypothetical protein
MIQEQTGTNSKMVGKCWATREDLSRPEVLLKLPKIPWFRLLAGYPAGSKKPSPFLNSFASCPSQLKNEAAFRHGAYC